MGFTVGLCEQHLCQSLPCFRMSMASPQFLLFTRTDHICQGHFFFILFFYAKFSLQALNAIIACYVNVFLALTTATS